MFGVPFKVPGFRRGSIGQVAVTSNEEKGPGAETGGNSLKPEKLNIELVKEVNIDKENNAGKSVANKGKEDEELPSSPVAPGAKKESKKH